MQPDIDMELETYETMEEDGDPEWAPIFDKEAFCKKHEELYIKDFKLEAELIKEYAIKATQLRQHFDDISQKFILKQQVPKEDTPKQRSRKGMIYSTKARNPDGLSQNEIKLLRLQDSIPMKKYAARKFKQLCADDLIDILHYVKCEYKTHAETARKYRVSVKLVGRIV